jgi:hypothetical protein
LHSCDLLVLELPYASLFGHLCPVMPKYRARLYVAMGMIRQTIAYPSRSQMPPLLGNYVRTSAPLRRHSAAGSNTEMRQRNSFLLPLGPKTHAHHGVNCALWGACCLVYLSRCKTECTCISVVQGSCSGQAAANYSSRPYSAVVTFRNAGGPPPVPWPLGIRTLRARGRPSLFTSMEGGAPCTTLLSQACLARRKMA